MGKTQRKGGKRNRKFGRASRRPKKARYESRNQRERNKLKRILRSCGESFARQWAIDRRVESILNKMVGR